MKEKRLPNWIRSETLRRLLRSELGVVLSYWVFQGMLYADWRESVLRCILGGILTYFFWVILEVPVYLSLIVAHTVNMVFNGHVIAMRRHMGLGANNSAKFVSYIEQFGQRVRGKSYIKAAAAFGSLTKDCYSPTSDIDVRIVPMGGQISFWRACLLALAERSRAVLSGFPLDLYVFSGMRLRKKMDSTEIPIVFHDPEEWLQENYESVIDVDQVIRSFKLKYV
jgi:predicted nucleotidyltransferase